MVNVVFRTEQISSYLDKMLYLHGECCEQSKSVHWTKCLYLYGECCEESNYQNVYTYMVNVVKNVYTYMVNVVSRANQFILGQNVYTYMVNVVSRAKCLYLHGECCEQSKSVHT